jgi:hypothetical protein
MLTKLGLPLAKSVRSSIMPPMLTTSMQLAFHEEKTGQGITLTDRNSVHPEGSPDVTSYTCLLNRKAMFDAVTVISCF